MKTYKLWGVSYKVLFLSLPRESFSGSHQFIIILFICPHSTKYFCWDCFLLKLDFYNYKLIEKYSRKVRKAFETYITFFTLEIVSERVDTAHRST